MCVSLYISNNSTILYVSNFFIHIFYKVWKWASLIFSLLMIDKKPHCYHIGIGQFKQVLP